MTQPELCKERLSTPLIGHKRCLKAAGFGDSMVRKRLRQSPNSPSRSRSPSPDFEEDTDCHTETSKNPSGLSFREAAVEILKELDRPLSAKELITRILSAGLVSTTGKTPDRTLASLIYSDIRTNGSKSRFRKVAKGLFGLRVRYYPAYDTTPPPAVESTAHSSKLKGKPKRSRCKPSKKRCNTSSSPTTSTSTSISGTHTSCKETCHYACFLCSTVTQDLHTHPQVSHIQICSRCIPSASLNQLDSGLATVGGLCSICGVEQYDPCPNCSLSCCGSCIERLQDQHKLDEVSSKICSKCVQTTCGFTPKNIMHKSPRTSSHGSQASREEGSIAEGRRRMKWHRYSFGSADSKMPFRRTRNDEDENGFLFLQYFLYINRKRKIEHLSPQYNQPEDDCFACKNGGNLLVCDYPQCSKVYHKSCVNMDSIPSGQWFCPRHYCSKCDRTKATETNALHQCITCPVSFCADHLPKNTTRYGTGIICSRCHYYLEKEITRI